MSSQAEELQLADRGGESFFERLPSRLRQAWAAARFDLLRIRRGRYSKARALMICLPVLVSAILLWGAWACGRHGVWRERRRSELLERRIEMLKRYLRIACGDESATMSSPAHPPKRPT